MEITKNKITEIFCIIDDFCQEYDKEIARMSICEPDGRKHRNRKWTMSRSEIMTILIYFHFNTFRNFKHYYLFYVKVHLHDLFPKQLSYNRFVELESRVAVEMMLFLQLFCFGRCTGISFIDSTCIPVCHNKRITRNKVFRDYAERGKSTMGWYFGFKLHLICNERGELLNFMLTKANVDDRNIDVFNRLSDNVFGKLFADKGYISQGLFERLFNDGIEIVTGLKCNMKNRLMPLYDKILLRKRSVIKESSDFDNMMNDVENEVEEQQAEDGLVNRVPELKQLSEDIDNATNTFINATLELESAIQQYQRAESKLGGAVTTISKKVDTINQHIDKVLENAPTKLKVSVNVNDADWQKIQELFAKERQWMVSQMQTHIREVNSMFADERKKVRERYKEYDGCYLGHYAQWFFWFFFTIGVFVIAGGVGMIIAQSCG